MGIIAWILLGLLRRTDRSGDRSRWRAGRPHPDDPRRHRRCAARRLPGPAARPGRPDRRVLRREHVDAAIVGVGHPARDLPGDRRARPTHSARLLSRRLDRFDAGDQPLDRLLRVAEEHRRLRVEVELVLDPGEARIHAPLEDDHVLRAGPRRGSASRRAGCLGSMRAAGFVTSFAPTTSATSVRAKSGLISSMSYELRRRARSASASRTFMCPGMRPATGWIAYFTSTPALLEQRGQLAHRVLRLRDRQPIAGHDHHRFARSASITAASSGCRSRAHRPVHADARPRACPRRRAERAEQDVRERAVHRPAHEHA